MRPQAKASGFMMRIVGGPWASSRNWPQRPRKKAGPSGPVPPQRPTCSCIRQPGEQLLPMLQAVQRALKGPYSHSWTACDWPLEAVGIEGRDAESRGLGECSVWPLSGPHLMVSVDGCQSSSVFMAFPSAPSVSPLLHCG